MEKPTMTSSITLHDVEALWLSLDESKHWGKLAWATRCVEMPEAVLIGESDADGGEVFAVLDMFERRVLSEEEFPSSHLHDGSGLKWVPVRDA
jgi:hypothetical protein